jgi:hypothetical protein
LSVPVAPTTGTVALVARTKVSAVTRLMCAIRFTQGKSCQPA